MSGRKQPTVTRDYRHEPDDCARALEILLKASVRNEGGVGDAPDDAVKELHGYDATSGIPESR